AATYSAVTGWLFSLEYYRRFGATWLTPLLSVSSHYVRSFPFVADALAVFWAGALYLMGATRFPKAIARLDRYWLVSTLTINVLLTVLGIFAVLDIDPTLPIGPLSRAYPVIPSVWALVAGWALGRFFVLTRSSIVPDGEPVTNNRLLLRASLAV